MIFIYQITLNITWRLNVLHLIKFPFSTCTASLPILIHYYSCHEIKPYIYITLPQCCFLQKCSLSWHWAICRCHSKINCEMKSEIADKKSPNTVMLLYYIYCWKIVLKLSTVNFFNKDSAEKCWMALSFCIIKAVCLFFDLS